MLRIIIVAMVVALAAPVAAGAAKCEERRKGRFGAVEFSVMETRDGRCWYLAGPVSRPSMFYRDYLFDDKGFILVFSSYGFGDENTTAGGREYHVFPRSHEVGATAGADGVRFTLANGASALYSARTAMWEDVRGAAIDEKPDVRIGDEGGWELRPRSGVVLDFGFRLGGGPSADRKGRATFVDADGETCSVSNAEVVEWSPDDDPSLKFADDAALESYLRARCPGISWR